MSPSIHPACDPLSTLGPSLFLQILSQLPLESLQTCYSVSKSWNELISSSPTTLYKPLAYSIGLEPPQLSKLEKIDKNTAKSSAWLNPRQDQSKPITSDTLHWKNVVKEQVIMQNNWKRGRAKGKWIYPRTNTAWRIKIDEEEGTIISTTRLIGVSVSDFETSEPLFEYKEVGGYAHLEFVKGYAIFNSNNDRSFEVHITPSALSRLSTERRSKLPPSNQSITHNKGYSFTNGKRYVPVPTISNEIPPRGHLTYYKSLTPRTECFAFRARIDRQYTPEERLVFGTSSTEEAYIYDLQSESDQEMENFIYEPEDRGPPNYIEFDDNYLYICQQFSVNVYSRNTKRKLLTFPPLFTAPFDAASAIYTCYDTSKVTKKIKPKAKDDILVGEIEIQGKWIDDLGFDAVMMASGQGRIAGRKFSAIHYTSNDLFAITRSGTIYALRNYHEIFSIQNPEERDKAVNANSLAIVLRECLLQLSTYGENVVITSSSSVFLLHTESLPKPPYNIGISQNPRMNIKLIKLLDIIQKGMVQCSCLQMDSKRIYIVYWALGEAEAGGHEDYEGNKILPPEQAINAHGLCVKVWDFSVE
ncbi:uncharacterized protein I206_102482 [Kwoniella pini CBS 10737]|uniref:F-box domain-containing protein n=1 Tax=Kwoniella pini CBS 10737 TaxID=1296096 RepID=A0A1B9I5I1_9TREE|nr:uncharacterized protein I206_02833 [Kwoniella pini CBS 10737]OCF50777.1 hypothetical protein I206_02833 [Kwoniella pini CBS 10737]